jgi:hypothetical protein
LVGEGIKNVFALAAARQQILGAKHAKALRNCRKFFAGGGGNLAHASLALGEHGKRTQARRVAHGTKDAGGDVEGGLVHRRQQALAVLGVVWCANLSVVNCCLHLNNYSSEI